MAISFDVHWDTAELRALHPRNTTRALARTFRKAGATALRDMRSEASKRIRARKRLKVRDVKKALHLRKPRRTSLEAEWRVDVSGAPVALVKYPHRQTKTGVRVEVNKGQRTLIRSAFIASMPSGHKGVFIRRGAQRLPIDELRGSRPVDALLHVGEKEAVAKRGQDSFVATTGRLLAKELSK